MAGWLWAEQLPAVLSLSRKHLRVVCYHARQCIDCGLSPKLSCDFRDLWPRTKTTGRHPFPKRVGSCGPQWAKSTKGVLRNSQTESGKAKQEVKKSADQSALVSLARPIQTGLSWGQGCAI